MAAIFDNNVISASGYGECDASNLTNFEKVLFLSRRLHVVVHRKRLLLSFIVFRSVNLIAALDRLSGTSTKKKEKESRTKNDKQAHTKRYHYLCDAFHYSKRICRICYGLLSSSLHYSVRDSLHAISRYRFCGEMPRHQPTKINYNP